MEEDRIIKRKKIFKFISRSISFTLIIFLMIIASFLILYVVSTKIADKKGETPPYSLYTIVSESMVPELKVYDVILVKKTEPSKLKEKDIITFYSSNPYFGTTPITHRIINIEKDEDSDLVFEVKGDNNKIPDQDKVISSNIIGKVILKFPEFGKIQFFLASKGGYIIAILIPALIILSYDIYKLIKLISLKMRITSLNKEDEM